MLSNQQALTEFFNNLVEGFKQDAQGKNQKIPVSSFRSEVDDQSGQLYAADYFKYLVYGREPGKFPPPDAMIDYVNNNPEILSRIQQVFKYITEQGAAYIIGRKIAKEGTDIYTGKKPGIDFLGVMEKNMPVLLQTIARNEAFNIATSIRQAVRK